MQKQDQEIHLLDYWRIISARRHIVISAFALIVGVVSVHSFVATPRYQSTVKLLVSQENATLLSFGEGGAPQIQIKDPNEYYNTQKKLLFSRNFVDRVIKKHDLDKNPYFVNKKEKSLRGSVFSSLWSFASSLFPDTEKLPVELPAELPDKEEREPWLTTLILGQMKVDVGRDSSIMEIHVTSDHPAMSASLANAIGAAYIEYTLDLRVTPYKNSVEWLTARLAELRGKVETSEKSLQQYKEQKGIVSHEARESILMQKLNGLVSALVTVQGARQESEVKYQQIKAVVDSPELLATVPDIMNNPVIQSLRTGELALRAQVSELSEKYGPKHPQLIKATAELEMLRTNIASEARKMLNAAKTTYEIALSREASLLKSIEAEKQEVLGLSRELINYRVVSEESANSRRFYEMLLKKLQEATLLGGVTVTNIQIIDSATPPNRPVSPNRQKNILLSMVIGLFSGIFLALFADYMDDSLKNQDDVETHLAKHFLGLVPSTPEQARPFASTAPIHEAYRTIRMGLKFLASERPLNAILITSAVPDEGKTTTAANLALVLAQMGERVLLIDADLRRPSIHAYFNLDNTIGLGSVIAERAGTSTAIKTVPTVPNLSVLTAGPVFPNPSEVLSSEVMKELVSTLRAGYDRIIIDSPPIMPVSDPLILSALADGVILVTRGGVTSRTLAQKACQALLKIQAPLIGIVLTNVKIAKSAYGDYYHPYGEVQKDGL